VDEARRVIRRLERIETLQGAHAPAADLLVEVRQLLREGEAWLAVEHENGGSGNGDAGAGQTVAAEAALRGCRATIGEGEEVVPRGAVSPNL
jgi:hypothetical protein